MGDLEDAIGERRLAVVDVRDDREVADAVEATRLMVGGRLAVCDGGARRACAARRGRGAAPSRGRRARPTARPRARLTSCAGSDRPSSVSRPYQMPYETPASTADERPITIIARRKRGVTNWPMIGFSERDEQERRRSMFDERRRERDPPHAERPVEDGVEHDVRDQRRDGDPRRPPGHLQAEERAVQHQHDAVEGEPERERGERLRDDVRLGRRRSARAGRRAAPSAARARRMRPRRGRAGTRSAAAPSRACGGRRARRARSRRARARGTRPSRRPPRTCPAGSM